MQIVWSVWSLHIAEVCVKRMHCSLTYRKYVSQNIWSNLINLAFAWFHLIFFPLSSLVIFNNFLHVIHLQWDSTRDVSIFITFVPSSPFLHLSPHHVIRYLVIRWIPRGWYVRRQTWKTFFISFINLSLHSSIPPSCASNRLLSHLRFSRRVADSDTEPIPRFNGSHLNHIHPHILKTTHGYSLAQRHPIEQQPNYISKHISFNMLIPAHWSTAVSWTSPHDYGHYSVRNPLTCKSR